MWHWVKKLKVTSFVRFPIDGFSLRRIASSLVVPHPWCQWQTLSNTHFDLGWAAADPPLWTFWGHLASSSESFIPHIFVLILRVGTGNGGARTQDKQSLIDIRHWKRPTQIQRQRQIPVDTIIEGGNGERVHSVGRRTEVNGTLGEGHDHPFPHHCYWHIFHHHLYFYSFLIVPMSLNIPRQQGIERAKWKFSPSGYWQFLRLLLLTLWLDRGNCSS